MRPQTMLSPLTGFVDAAMPDAEGARRFAWMVQEFLDDAPRYQVYRAELTAMLAEWQAAGAALGPIIDRSPALKEIKPLTKGLSDLGEVGSEALSYLKLGAAPVRARPRLRMLTPSSLEPGLPVRERNTERYPLRRSVSQAKVVPNSRSR